MGKKRAKPIASSGEAGPHPHDGIIYDYCTYTTKRLAKIIGYKQARSAEEACNRMGVPVRRLGAKALVSGYEFRKGLEAQAHEARSEGVG